MIGRTKWQAIVVLCGTFGLGAVAGIAGARVYFRHEQAAALVEAPPAERDHRRLRALARRLDLSEAQLAQVREIFERHRAVRDALIREGHDGPSSARRELRDQLEHEIREVLTPEQRERFDEMRQRRARRFGPPHGG